MALWIIASLLAVVTYSAACWIRPFSACGRCSGTGKHRSPSAKAWRKCRWCKGSGMKLRFGRRAWTWTHRTYSKGNS